MTRMKAAKAVPENNRLPIILFKVLLVLGGLCLIGGGVWYMAITGIVGIKRWDFMKYGLTPALMAIAGGVILVLDIAAYFTLPCFKEVSLPLKRDLKRDKARYMLMLPGLLAVFVFSYMPMYGIVLAFKDYKIKSGIIFSEWCGLEKKLLLLVLVLLVCHVHSIWQKKDIIQQSLKRMKNQAVC